MIQINKPIFNKTSFSGQTPEKTKTPASIQKQIIKDEFVSKEDKQEKKKKKAWLEGVLTATIIIGGLAALAAWIVTSHNKATQNTTKTFSQQGNSKFKEGNIEEIKKNKRKILDIPKPKAQRHKKLTEPREKLAEMENNLETLTKALDKVRTNIAKLDKTTIHLKGGNLTDYHTMFPPSYWPLKKLKQLKEDAVKASGGAAAKPDALGEYIAKSRLLTGKDVKYHGKFYEGFDNLLTELLRGEELKAGQDRLTAKIAQLKADMPALSYAYQKNFPVS